MMFRIRSRLNHILTFILGPYRKYDYLHIHVDTFPQLGEHFSSTFSLQDLTNWTYTGDPQSLSIALKATPHALLIKSNNRVIFKQATLLGWKTLFDSQMIYDTTPVLTLPFAGWWKLEVPSSRLELSFEYDRVRFNKFQDYLKWIKTLVLNQHTPALLLAALIHYAFFAFALGERNFPYALEKRLSTSIEVPVQMIRETPKVPSNFAGNSINAALERSAKRNFRPQDMTSQLKSLSSLMRSGTITHGFSIHKNENLPLKAAPSEQLDLKSYQASLINSGLNLDSSHKISPQNFSVRWKQQFISEAAQKTGQHSTLTDAQQQRLAELFAAKQEKFRNCYETALLKFEEMTVTISFEGEIHPDGRITNPYFKTSGRTTNESQDVLVKCLKTVMSDIQFDTKLSGTRVKNQFIFKL